MNALMDQLLKLSLAEKRQIIDALWDDIAAEFEPAGIPKEHKAEMRRRAEEFAADPSIAISEEELWARVDQLGEVGERTESFGRYMPWNPLQGSRRGACLATQGALALLATLGWLV